jgi:hypothetical protein
MPETDAPEQDACHDQISEEVGSEARTSAREREAEITRERGRAAKSASAMFLTPPSDTTAAHIFNFELGGGPPAIAAAAAAATAHSAAATAAAAAATAAGAAAAAAAGPEIDLSPQHESSHRRYRCKVRLLMVAEFDFAPEHEGELGFREGGLIAGQGALPISGLTLSFSV